MSFLILYHQEKKNVNAINLFSMLKNKKEKNQKNSWDVLQLSLHMKFYKEILKIFSFQKWSVEDLIQKKKTKVFWTSFESLKFYRRSILAKSLKIQFWKVVTNLCKTANYLGYKIFVSLVFRKLIKEERNCIASSMICFCLLIKNNSHWYKKFMQFKYKNKIYGLFYH